MAKNIILCADGTGNKGGYTPDSNVYKMYHAVDIHIPNDPQVIFYDNGVGTDSNKLLKALGGGVGWGFAENVRDLYQSLARVYEKDDQVFLFGFSRGAATIRALSGFIHTCGLVKSDGLTDDELKGRVKEEFKNYIKWRRDPSSAKNLDEIAVDDRSHGVIKIQMLGVWDTVTALGFPKRTDIVSGGMWFMQKVFTALDKVTDCIPSLEHLFYNYGLTDNVQYAYQALALDDSRTAFWPWVWDEHGRKPEDVEQVWFVGMHSNVGGGYNRGGLANVTLAWMMERAAQCGLTLRKEKVEETEAEAHAYGLIHDSRDGLATYYRYHPRELQNLCRREKTDSKRIDVDRLYAVQHDDLDMMKENADVAYSNNKLLGEIKIHDSVIRRMGHRTKNYAPTQLPDKFSMVDGSLNDSGTIVHPAADNQWADEKRGLRKIIRRRKKMYATLLEVTIAFIGFAVYFWLNPPESFKTAEWQAGVVEWLNFGVDKITGMTGFFEGFITTLFSNRASLILLVFIPVFIWLRIRAKKNMLRQAERIRCLVMKAVDQL